MGFDNQADRPSSASQTGTNLAERLLALCAPLQHYKTIALSVSGGSDSLAMLHIVHRWAKAHGRLDDLLVLCVDHGLRLEAKREACDVMAVAKALKIRAKTLVWQPDTMATSRLQERAAKARYELMAKACQSENNPCLLVAHQKEDQIETFLMRLAKGSGVDGLGAMEPVIHRYGIDIVRPFLSISKQELREFLLEIDIDQWVEDPTNQDIQFERAHWRGKREALENLGLSYDQLGKSQQRLARAGDALQLYAKRWFDRHARVSSLGIIDLPVPRLRLEPEECQLRILQMGLQMVRCQDYVSLSQLEALHAQIQSHDKGDQSVLGGVLFQTRQCKELGELCLTLYAEPGRTKPAFRPLHWGDRFVWDDRLQVRLIEQQAETSSSLTGYHLAILGRDNMLRLKADDQLPSHIPDNAAVVLAALYEGEQLLMVPQLNLDLRKEKVEQKGLSLACLQIQFPRNGSAI